LRTFYAAYSNLYAPLSPKSASGQHAGEIQSVLENAVQELASEHALATEKEVFKASHTNAVTYRNSIRTTLVGIVRRQKEEATSSEIRKLGDNARRHMADLTGDIDGPELKKTAKDILQSSEMIGTPSEVRIKLAALEERAKGRLTIGRIEKHDLIATDAQLILCQYPVPPDFAKSADLTGTMTDAWGSGDEQHSLEGQEVACGRCTTKFIVRPLQEGDADAEACCYHWGRRRFVHDVGRNRGPRTPRWTCCGATDEGATLMSTAQIARDSGMVKETEGAGSVFVDGAAGCIRGPHVFKEEECELLHRREAFKTTTAVLKELSEAQRSANKTERLDVLAFDCELVYTTAGMSLARLTVLDESGKAVLDVYVRPRAAVLDYNTRFSGIRCSNLEGQVSTLPQARQALVQLMRPDSILVGHGLENDLKAVRLVHTRIIDSAILYPHPKGLPFRMSLRELTRIHLGRYIQQDSDEQGHDAEEDARAALELIRRRFAELAASGAKQIEPVTSRPVNPFTRPSAAPPVPPTTPSPATTSSLFLPKAKRR
jgi:RNA exonuclease 1